MISSFVHVTYVCCHESGYPLYGCVTMVASQKKICFKGKDLKPHLFKLSSG